MKNMKYLGIGLVGILLIIGFVAIYNTYSNPIEFTEPNNTEPNNTEPYININNSYARSSHEPRTYDELQDKCSIIVSGKIISISESIWSTPDGKKPEGFGIIKVVNESGTYLINNASFMGDVYIYTDVVFELETIYKGDLKEDEIVVRFFTGISDGWRSSDEPGLDIQSYEEGKTYLFFLAPLRGDFPNHYGIIAPRGALIKQEISPISLISMSQNQETFVNFYGGQFTPQIIIE